MDTDKSNGMTFGYDEMFERSRSLVGAAVQDALRS